MATNLDLDDKLISQVKKMGHYRTKKEAVMAALREYVARKKQLKILNLFGQINFDDDYNYKAARAR